MLFTLTDLSEKATTLFFLKLTSPHKNFFVFRSINVNFHFPMSYIYPILHYNKVKKSYFKSFIFGFIVDFNITLLRRFVVLKRLAADIESIHSRY